MKRYAIIAVVLGAILIERPCHAQLTVSHEGTAVTVKSDRYALTLDAGKGGTITRMGGRAVEAKDSAGEYALRGDTHGEVVIKEESPTRAVVVAKARFVKNGEEAPSRILAESTYVFAAGSPVVRCSVVLRQEQVPLYADVSGYPSWPSITLLDFGGKPGWKGPMSGDMKAVRIYLDPSAESPFDVPSEAKAKIDQLALPSIARGAPLLQDAFQTDENWSDIAGTWRIEGGTLVERSPQADFAWTVAGRPDWKDYIVQTEVHTVGGSEIVFLCARWQDVADHYELQYLEWPGNCARIVRVRGGRRQTLAEVRNLPDLRADPPTKLWLEVSGNHLRAYRDGELLLEARDAAFDRGQIAVGTASEYPVTFHRVDVYALQAAPDNTPVVRLFEPVQRHAFYREEGDSRVGFIVSPETALAGARVTFTLTCERYPTEGDLDRSTIDLGPIGAGEEREISYELHPAMWRSEDYTLTAVVERDSAMLAREETALFIRRKPNPDRMLVQAWDRGDPARLAEFGFNRYKITQDTTMSRWTDGKYRTPDDPMRNFAPSAAATRQRVIDQFDDALKNGMWGYIQIEYLRRVPEGVVDAYALKRNGKDLQDRANDYFEAGQPRPNPWHPKVAEVDADFFRKSLSAWKDLPAWNAVILNSESENNLDVYGNDYFLAMAKKELGFDVPEDAVGPRWPEKGNEIPKDGIIDSNDHDYRFYRWWWERGEGQGMLHAKVAKAIKEIRPDVICWHDPALRQPFVRGRLAGLDEILNWSYAWPNIARFPLIADELRLAAVDDQSRIFNIQLIVWGGSAIPREGPHWSYVKRGSYLPAHSPATVREATWLVLARGVSGVSYHGVETVDEFGMTRDDARKRILGVGYRGYMYSNPDTLSAIKDVSERVMQPYGMVIKNLHPARGQVAMLLSTANVVFSRRDTEDFVLNEAGHMYAKLLAAHVAVDPLYEVDVEEGKLAGYKAVALPGCRVLPRHIYDAVKAFADAGHPVIADQHLVPSFPNVVTLPRDAGAWGGEAPLQKEDLDQAKIVHEALDARISRWADCDSPSVVLSVLDNGPAKYLFVINNLRRTGDYMEPWKKVLDDGVAQKTTVRIRESDCVVYDALAQRQLAPRDEGGRLSWEVGLGPGEGRIFAVLPEAVAAPAIAVTETVAKGAVARIDITTAYTGRLPLRVTIRDSQGVENEYSDYILADEGKASIDVPIARNDPSGDWSVTVRELLGGAESRAFFTVESDSAGAGSAE